MSGIRVTADEEIPEFNWTLEKGYQGSLLDSNIYPFNSLGAVLGKPISFVFSLRKDDLTIDCETFQGFKVSLNFFSLSFIDHYLNFFRNIFFLLVAAVVVVVAYFNRFFYIHKMKCRYIHLTTLNCQYKMI